MWTTVFRKLTRSAAGPQSGLTLMEMLVGMIIMAVISTMLVGGWISLQRSYAFTSVTNQARATARDALDHMESALRASQPPTTTDTTQFYLSPPRATLSSTYLSGSPASPCGPTTCVFYTTYNNQPGSDGTGWTRVQLTAIWLDTSGTKAQKTLYLTRDSNNNGALEASDRKIVLARNVVNTASAINRSLFTYFFRDASSGAWSHASTLSSTSVPNLRSIQLEIVVDVNLSHTPTYVDLRTTVRPRNASAIF
jgi:prepilin-type N-terminal cleavage/methylation domain-containing protein